MEQNFVTFWNFDMFFKLFYKPIFMKVVNFFKHRDRHAYMHTLFNLVFFRLMCEIQPNYIKQKTTNQLYVRI